jgi:hypothetical protein
MPYENIKKLFDSYLRTYIAIMKRNADDNQKQKYLDQLSEQTLSYIFRFPILAQEIGMILQEKSFEEITDYSSSQFDKLAEELNFFNLPNGSDKMVIAQHLSILSNSIVGFMKKQYPPLTKSTFESVETLINNAMTICPTLTPDIIIQTIADESQLITMGTINMGEELITINPFRIEQKREVYKMARTYFNCSETINKFLKIICWLIQIEDKKRIGNINSIPTDYGKRIKLIKDSKYRDLVNLCNNEWRNAMVGHNTYKIDEKNKKVILYDRDGKFLKEFLYPELNELVFNLSDYMGGLTDGLFLTPYLSLLKQYLSNNEK